MILAVDVDYREDCAWVAGKYLCVNKLVHTISFMAMESITAIYGGMRAVGCRSGDAGYKGKALW